MGPSRLNRLAQPDQSPLKSRPNPALIITLLLFSSFVANCGTYCYTSSIPLKTSFGTNLKNLKIILFIVLLTSLSLSLSL